MTWTTISKPTDATWTGVAKPAEDIEVLRPVGTPIGLLLALTYADPITSVLTGWSGIAKPSTYNWSNVAKPTT